MINSDLDALRAPQDDEAVESVVRAGPRGAVILAAIATVIVVGCWFAFYLLVFAERGVSL
jgi:hypothetical protein